MENIKELVQSKVYNMYICMLKDGNAQEVPFQILYAIVSPYLTEQFVDDLQNRPSYTAQQAVVEGAPDFAKFGAQQIIELSKKQDGKILD